MRQETALAGFDLAIIGGGINGCGIAREAAGCGFSVVLCEQDDLASATSSASTKLIHGGLRYLEHYDFRLVREALQEREVLWRLAPHIIRPLRFVLPHHAGLRPAWLLRLGLFLYDHLGKRKLLPPTRTLRLADDPAGAPLKAGHRLGFEYSDCWVEDARLVVLNAMDAASRGAVIRTRSRCVGCKRDGEGWLITVKDVVTGQEEKLRAAALVNASGPWVARVLSDCLSLAGVRQVRLVQGSHIVVPRLYEHDRCYIFQNADGRIVFAIPFEGDFTLIGTTDRDFQGDPARVAASAEEIAYLCAAANEYFTRQIAPADVVWTYSGVRPLFDDGSQDAASVTRDYVLTLDAPAGKAAALSVFGGKITTYRRLAQAAIEKIASHLPRPVTQKPGWSGTAPLPGGDFPVDGVPSLAKDLCARHPWLQRAHAHRLACAYGTRANQVLGDAASEADLGRRFGADLTEREVEYLIAQEWARSATDVLWRRSKLGLRFTAAQAEALAAWFAKRLGDGPPVGGLGPPAAVTSL